MNEEENKAIETLKEIISHKEDFDYAYGTKFQRPYAIGHDELKELDVVLNLIQKQEKIINAMGECIHNYQICDYEIKDCGYRKCEYVADDETPHCKECIIEYFKEEVEKNEQHKEI